MPRGKTKPVAKPRAKQAAKKPAAKKSVAPRKTKPAVTAKAKPKPKPQAAAKAKPKATVDPRWAALVTELQAKEQARDAIDPFRRGWASSDKQIETWKQLNEAVKDVRDRMDRYIAGLSDGD